MRVAICGYYGYEEIGREAIAQAFEHYLKKPKEGVEICYFTRLAQEQTEAIARQKGFYTKDNLFPLEKLAEDKEGFDIIIVGGGDLPASFALSVVEKAKLNVRNKIVARIGVSAQEDYLQNETCPEIIKRTKNCYDFISVRDESSQHFLKTAGIDCHLGADLAMDPLAIFSQFKPTDSNYAVLSIAKPKKEDEAKHEKLIRLAYSEMEKNFSNVIIVPFSEADKEYSQNVFLREFDKKNSTFIVKLSQKNAPVAARMIANAQYVISIGKLHPLVFSVGLAKPCMAITYPAMGGYNKVASFMHSAHLGHRVTDWSLPEDKIHDAIKNSLNQEERKRDTEIVEVSSSILKGRMLRSFFPIWSVMGIKHGLGLERGLKEGEFRPDFYDDSYYFGSRVFRENGEFQIYQPSVGHWTGWDIIRDVVMSTVKPQSLLDVGCSRGWFVQRMINVGVAAEGIDMSKAAIDRCAPGMKNYIQPARIQEISRKFDTVISFDVMEHIFLEDIPGFIAALKERAEKHLVLNICVRDSSMKETTLKKNEPVPEDLEWMAVSGHVTLRDHNWWKVRIEDKDWKFDPELVNKAFAHEKFDIPAWRRENFFIFTKK